MFIREVGQNRLRISYTTKIYDSLFTFCNIELNFRHKARFVSDLCNIRFDRSKSLQLAFFYYETNHGRFLIYLTGSSSHSQTLSFPM